MDVEIRGHIRFRTVKNRLAALETCKKKKEIDNISYSPTHKIIYVFVCHCTCRK